MEALTTLKESYQAAQMYDLTNGIFPQSFGQLDTTIPWQGKELANTYAISDFISNKNWALAIWSEQNINVGMIIERLSGPYTGSGFFVWKSYQVPNLQPNKIYCFERHSGNKVFKQKEGSFCAKLFKGTKIFRGGFVQYYQISWPN